MRLFSVAALLLSAVSVAGAQSAAWAYVGKDGPENWGRLDRAYKACSDGHQQSPIDIRGARLDKTLGPIEYHYISGPVTLENDGHTIIGHVNPGSYILAGGTRYELQQFQFHHPSEEGVKGKLTDMSVHLLHSSVDGRMAVIAVRFVMDRGEANAVMATLWPHLPATAGKIEKVDEMVNPGGFLPADRSYWTYMGSLSRPPCTEGVRWFVYQEPLSMSNSQLSAFSALFRVNSRPLQEAHGRRIQASE
jgi:carbonic anhydrase